MFTGIVEEVGTATLVEEGRLSFASRHALQELAIGDSISVNGACLTITSIEEEVFSVDVMPETLRRTNLVDLKVGDPVNLEKPLTLSSRLGGHIMQGHVDGRGRVLSVTPEGDAMIMEIEAPTDLMRYIVAKGFIGVDGASLTVMDRREETFTVSLVSYTWENTTLRERNPNDWVNLEVDILAKYVEQLIKGDNSGVSLYSLAQQGES
ncbi:MAG: riboflavin synthase [Chloroflexi bacterium]|nr:riboflavin synthase [Chloroflexota bacterium]MCH9037464.1 riboflavin synthase [Chloroflexota bacterium]